MSFVRKHLFILVLNDLAVMLTNRLHIFCTKTWTPVEVSGSFGSATVLVKVIVHISEVDDSAGNHVVVWVLSM